MYIGKVNQDLDLDVFERHYTLKKGQYYLAKDGILYKELVASYCQVIKETGDTLSHRLPEGYLVAFDDLDKELHIAIYGAESWLNKIEQQNVKEEVKDGHNSKSKKRRNDA